MRGGESILRALTACGVDTCFTNPGTSEIYLVQAFDRVPTVRPILALFEGVATGAADGYGRMTKKPALVVLHLGPGLANGIANLHNARRARTPLLCVIGDHATYHKPYDSPLETDIDSLAKPVSNWFHRSLRTEDLVEDAISAYNATLRAPGRVATLVVSADLTWTDHPGTTVPSIEHNPTQVKPAWEENALEETIKALRSGESCTLLLGGPALEEKGLLAASRIANSFKAKILCEMLPAKQQRGTGLPALERLAYLGELAMSQLDGTRHLILVGAKAPVSFFAYPDKPSYLVPEGCTVHTLATADEDPAGALEAISETLGLDPATATLQPPSNMDLPTGRLTPETVAQAIGALLPEGAIVSDEGNTSGIFVYQATAGAPRHDWLCLTGGAIGQGLPLATGASVACPDRKVLCLESDGSAMYTIQSLWTQAREGLDVVTVILNNRSYAILKFELARLGGGSPGPIANHLLELSPPDLDFVSIANGLGVEAGRATTAEEFVVQLKKAMAEQRPYLIDAILERS